MKMDWDEEDVMRDVLMTRDCLLKYHYVNAKMIWGG